MKKGISLLSYIFSGSLGDFSKTR